MKIDGLELADTWIKEEDVKKYSDVVQKVRMFPPSPENETPRQKM